MEPVAVSVQPVSITIETLIEAGAVYIGFVILLFLASKFLPGKICRGAVLPDGTRLSYKINGHWQFIGVMILVALGTYLDLFSLTILYTHFWPFFIAANVFAFGLSLILYLQGTHPSGNFLTNYFLGTQINPNWFGVDLKHFSYRPSLIGLTLLNLSFAFVQYERHDFISTPMWLFQIFTFVYLASYFQFEDGALFMWDMIAERFGWMLVWGDFVLVPFFYCITGWYLIDQTEPLSGLVITLLCLLYLFGFWLFRGTNQQKFRFKQNPNTTIWGKPAESIEGVLLVSGFWGIGRKLNYTGEILIYLSWTLACGFQSLVPYTLVLWLACLLIHRAWRDEQRCQKKYGELWQTYCRRAKFRMIPFVY